MKHPVAASVAASLALGLATLAGPAAASPAPSGGSLHLRWDAGTEHEYRVRLDDARMNDGLDPLDVTADLVDAARRHAAEMADAQRTYPDAGLGDEVDGWVELGAVVARGGTVKEVHHGWLSSPADRAEMFHAPYTQVGTGVAWGQDGRMYVSHVFRVPDPSYTPPAEAETDAEIATARRTGDPGASFGRVEAAPGQAQVAGVQWIAGSPATRDGSARRATLAGSAGADPVLGEGTAPAGSTPTDRNGQPIVGPDELLAAQSETQVGTTVATLLALVAGVSLLASSTLLVRVATTRRPARYPLEAPDSAARFQRR